MKSLDKLAIHSITTLAWDLETIAKKFPAAGVQGVTVWRQALKDRDPRTSGAMLRDAGLSLVSYCRGGFFPGINEKERLAAIDDNKRCLEEAAALGAPLVVLVCGAVPGMPLTEARKQITEGIAACVETAEATGVKLSIEPLHPMYAGDRSAVNTMAQAREICESIGSKMVGIAMDCYHVWWDPFLNEEVEKAAAGGWLDAFHICDWKCPTEDMLNDRGLMGEGCIPIKEIREKVESCGFDGFHEVEIFSDRYWAMDPDEYLAMIVKAYQEHS